MLTDKLGYIKINRFAESTYKEFKQGLDKLQGLGAAKIALDLRDNPGGFLDIAVKIVDEFLEDDKLILFTKNKRGNIEESFATEKGDFEEGEVYVLIDENSASASEIVAGALQDNDKGTIVGRRSYGKGLVQHEMDLGDGSAVRLTVSRYYTPTGRSIQRPYKKGHKDYYDEYSMRIQSGELLDSEKIQVVDSLKYTTPKGKIVQRRGYIAYFVFEELEKSRNIYYDVTKQDFIDSFEVDDDMVFAFQDYINVRTASKITFVAYHDEVKQYLKATLADQLYGTDAYEEILNKRDIMIDELISLSEGKE